jgi:hypothetical protein
LGGKYLCTREIVLDGCLSVKKGLFKAAKEQAASAPIPVPPPVITIVFPVAESWGRVGEMDA